MKTIKTTWGKIFENDGLVLFNNYPKIVCELNKYEELDQWESEDEYKDEIYQWYIVPNESTVEWLKRFCPEIAEDVHYSETMDQYMLAVYHFGTGWDAVQTEIQIYDKDEDLFPFYKKIYHDGLPDWVKEDVLNEKGEK